MSVNKLIPPGTEMKSITVSNANATWENASSKVSYYETLPQDNSEKVSTQAVNENYSFVTEWCPYNNEVVKPVYEYKPKDDFIVDW